MEEEAALEAELEAQLADQETSLAALAAALLEDQNDELLEMQQELLEAARAAKDGLLHLKRSRLLREVTAMAQDPPNPHSLISNLTDPRILPHGIASEVDRSEDVARWHLESSGAADEGGSAASPPVAVDRDERGGASLLDEDADGQGGAGWTAGARCRFRHTDGRWYAGEVLSVAEEQDPGPGGASGKQQVARVGFAFPTSEPMQVCWFFRQGRCRFNDTCRLSHGFSVPLGALRAFVCADLRSLPLGGSVLATPHMDGSGTWRKAELESKDLQRNVYAVAFVDDGSRAEVGMASVTALDDRDDISSDSDDRSSCSSDENDEDVNEDEIGFIGMGTFAEAEKMARAGVQMETITFAEWEQHTRGIASKMMAAMGFRQGMGLGREGQGIAEPLEVRVLPPKKSLDFISGGEERKDGGAQTNGGNDSKKKTRKGRGGERRRRQKWAKAVKEAKAKRDKDYAPDVFSFINGQLAKRGGSMSSGGKSQGNSRPGEEGKGSGGNLASRRQLVPIGKEDRKALMAREDHLRELTTRISKLEEMADRNKRDKAVHAAVQIKLGETRRAFAEARAAHDSTKTAIQHKESTRKWMKF